MTSIQPMMMGRIRIRREPLGMIFLSFLLIKTVCGVKYGPSLDFLISSATPKELHLDGFAPSYSTVIPLTNGSSTGLVGRVHPTHGEFVLLAPPGFGIMVVVQSLRLRTGVVYSTFEFTTLVKCRDWIQIVSGSGGQTSKVCGHVTKYSKESSPPNLFPPGSRAFLTNESRIAIALHLDVGVDHRSKSGEEYQPWQEQIAVELVVTAFKPCPKPGLLNQIKKLIPGSSANSWKSCSPSEDKVCVHSSVFCDGVANCGVKGPLGHIGYDEEKCVSSAGGGIGSWFKKKTPEQSATPTSTTTPPPYIGVDKPYVPPSGKVISPIHLILIFAVVVLLLFGVCTWLAKANEKKFQHTMYRFSTIRRQRRGNNRRDRDQNRQRSDPEREEGTIRRPSAPVVFDTIEISGEEPPPYHDLFPNASAPPAEDGGIGNRNNS